MCATGKTLTLSLVGLAAMTSVFQTDSVSSTLTRGSDPGSAGLGAQASCLQLRECDCRENTAGMPALPGGRVA